VEDACATNQLANIQLATIQPASPINYQNIVNRQKVKQTARIIITGIAIVVLTFSVQEISAQNSRFDVSGVVVDTSGVGIPSATIVALTRADSVLTKFATSDNKGAFTMKRLVAGEYILQISFVGFQTIRENFEVANANVDVGQHTLHVLVSELDELVVSAEHIPFRVSKDTLSYNAAAFATRPNAVVEDLLRRLPGIEVEEDGTITAQGETVQNVLVDGKEFFGSDATIATKNLPADAVESVQVYDKQSDTAEFTGIEDGEEQRTINLELKEDAKSGYFGNVSGGFGGENSDQRRYDGQASINRFNSNTQLALIANANNVNKTTFGWSEFITFSGGMQNMRDGMGGGGIQVGGRLNDGFAETLALGLNASHDFSDKTWVRTSYFRSSLDNNQNRFVNQESVLGSSLSSLTQLSSDQSSENIAHRVNINAQFTFSEGHDMRLRSDLSFASSSLGLTSNSATAGNDNRGSNSALTQYFTSGDKTQGSARLTWRRKLNEAGRSLILYSRTSLNDSDLSADLTSTLGTIDPRTDLMTYDEVAQLQSTVGDQLSQQYRLSLTEPLGFATLELSGERQVQDQDETKSFFDINAGGSTLNELLSSEFNRSYSYWKGTARLNRSNREQSLNAALTVQTSDLEGTIVNRDQNISNGYTHILPSVVFRKTLSETSTLSARYTTSTREPSLTQLQPFSDNSDPLNVYTGNPDLIPEYRHSIYSDYRFFDQFTFINVFASIRSTYSKNQIVQARTIDSQLKQTITNVNAKSGLSSSARVRFGSPIRKLGVNLNIDNNITHSTGTQLINGEENDSRIIRNTTTVSFDNRIKDQFEIRASVSATYNNLNYSLNSRLNQSYINNSVRFSGEAYLGQSWTVGSSINLRRFDSDVFGSNDNLALLEASISRLLPDGRTEIELVGLDLLDQNQGVNFSNFSSYVQEERIETLGRYVMLRVVHKLSGMGPGGRGGRGGGGRR